MTLGSQGKYKKALLQFLADNMDYTDYMRGIDNLTPDQLTVLVEKAIHKIKTKAENANTVKELIEKHIPVKIGNNGEYEPKTQSVIECCLHCGSVAIKKHGKTTGGVQRYKCKDCNKTFTENYGLITHYSHLSDWQWKEVIRGTIEGLSLTEIAKNIGTSASTVWSCRMKIYQTIKNIYGYCDTFNNIVEADGKYERISFKGKKDKNFFVEQLGRLSRHHRSKKDRIEYLEACGKYDELLKTKPHLLKEMIYSSQKRMVGRDKIDIGHQHVCILTAIDRTNSIYIEPVTAGTAKSNDVYSKFIGKVTKDAVFVTDDHHSYKMFTRSEQIKHIRIESGAYTNSAFNLGRVNSLHSAIDRFFGSNEYKPATKYLDLYLMMFWWLQKNKDLNGRDLSQKLFDTMTGKVSMSERANMKRITIKSLVNRELPIDTKGFYPKCA